MKYADNKHENDVSLQLGSYLKHRYAKCVHIVALLCLSMGVTEMASAESLKTWDIYSTAADNPVMQKLDKNFEAAHPGVTIKRTTRNFDDLELTLKLAVSSGDGPEVTKVNQGAGDMGAMVKQGMLLPLDPYIKKYGWDKEQSQSVLARDRWTKSGKFGVGKTYGISNLGELVGLFYNTKVLASAGIKTPPESFQEFLKDMDILKKQGITPMMMGTANGHMALHMFAALSQAHIDASHRQALDKLIYGQGGSWKTKANIEAAQLMQRWAKEGYFFPGYQGIGGDDSVPLFIANQSGFLIGGSWYFGEMKSNPNIHFMAIPAPQGVKHPLTVGGVDVAWAITNLANSKAKQALAASYINYMVSPEVAVVWANAGFLPAIPLPKGAKLNVSGLLEDSINVWANLNKYDALGHYPDWASPTMLRTFDDNTPLLLANRETPQAFVDKLQADYDAYMKTKN